MKYNSYHIVFFLLIILINSACDFYRPLPTSDNNSVPKLVVNAILDNQTDEKLIVNVSASQPLTSGNNTISLEDLYINDAVVLFFQNDILIDTLLPLEYGEYVLSKSFTPIVGAFYRITVEHSDYENVQTTEVQMPSLPNIVSITREAVLTSNKDRVNFTIQDEVNITNFYEIAVKVEIDSSGFLEEEYISFGDYYIEDPACGLGQVIFPDYCFENEHFSQEILITHTDVTKMEFSIAGLSESYYNFFKNNEGVGLDAFSQIFSEPNITYSNVENGYGVFYAKNAVALEI